MKIIIEKQKEEIATAISKIIQTMTNSAMEIDDIEKCLDELYTISYNVSGVLNTQTVLKLIQSQRYDG